MAEEYDEAAARQRIITHMNNDHQVALLAYLRVYCNVTAKSSFTPKMEDVNLLSMVISYGGSRYSVPVDPPMKSLRESRSRLFDMRSRCFEQLGESDITLREYAIPRGLHALIFSLCLSGYICLSQPSNFLPGSFLYTYVFGHFPKVANFFYTVQPAMFYSMILIHVVEASLMAVKVLKPHRVPVFSGLWWTWMISTFIEGYGAFQRTDMLVKKERARVDEARAGEARPAK
ncbi:hypothetical protein FQN54_005636 [Arachnomyces sp. PD_36]|nr:hypothetical protein FQN54_005636 [Arachnomyces sp. PD_36]